MSGLKKIAKGVGNAFSGAAKAVTGVAGGLLGGQQVAPSGGSAALSRQAAEAAAQQARDAAAANAAQIGADTARQQNAQAASQSDVVEDGDAELDTASINSAEARRKRRNLFSESAVNSTQSPGASIRL